MEMIGQHQALAALPPVKKPDTHCTGGWAGNSGGLDVSEKRKIISPCRGSDAH